MVNEIPVELFIVMLLIDMGFIAGAWMIRNTLYHTEIMFSVLATTFTFVLSHTLLNGNIYILKNDDTLLTVQSLPFFYLLEGLGMILVIYTAILIYSAIKESFEKHSVFESMNMED